MLVDSWKMIQIKDICQLGRGRVINQDELYAHPGEYPVYSS
ncbi:MAG: restriction endonuclease subunit S, partial [Deltaproteobacteria bacterium]|nr:restriction endonuclease subunit S [Deltaproteobacteria bacterium]